MNKRPFTILLLCLLIILGALLTACNSTQVESNPEEVVNGFLEAFMADDLDQAMTYFSDDAVFNAVNADEEMIGKEDISGYIGFLMRQVIDMETRNFNIDGNQVTWEASLERTSTPTEISYIATIEEGLITYMETNQIIE